MDQQTYHVLLDGRAVGPYDRKTILGMRVKRMLAGDQLLATSGGSRLTVRELIGAPPRDSGGPASRNSTSSRAQATYTGMLVALSGRGFAIPRFKGELELRVHPDVLRLAGRYRRFFRWTEGRIKLPLKAVVQAAANGEHTEILLRAEGSAGVQRLEVYMFDAEAAQELAGWLAPK